MGGVAPAPFIVGVARSGTTLLRLMFDAHPALAIPPETYLLLPIFRAGVSGEGAELGRDEFERLICEFHTWPDLGISRERLREELASLEPFTARQGLRTVYRLYAEERGKSRWGDKTPNYRRHLPAIAAMLPEARFLHIVRDGRDVALSLRREWFAPAEDMAGLARHWVEEIDATRQAMRQCVEAGGHAVELRYEDLVLQPRVTLEGLCAFVELPFDPSMLTYHRGAPARIREVGDQRLPDGRVITKESRHARHQRVGDPPDPSRLGVWRREMSADDQREFASIAGGLLEELGY